jgi:hypothetical protein
MVVFSLQMMLPPASLAALIVFEKLILAPAPSSSTIVQFFQRIIGPPAGQSRRDGYKSAKNEQRSQTEGQHLFSHDFHPFPDHRMISNLSLKGSSVKKWSA